MIYRNVTMGELVSVGAVFIGDGYRTKRSEHGSVGFRIIRVADVLDDVVALDGPDFVSEDFSSQIGAKAGREGDVLLTTKGTVGRVAIMPKTDQSTVYSPQLCFFRVLDPSVIDARYLRYWFSTPNFWRQATHRMNNTDMAAYINLVDIKSLSLDLLATETQRAIVQVLGALDDKIAANAKQAEIGMRLARLTFESAVRDIPRRAMSEVLVPTLGGTPARSDASLWGGSHLWASAKDITAAQFGVVVDTQKKISDRAVEITRAKPLPQGSVILTARGTVGAVARLGKSASFNQSCYGFEVGPFSASVLYFALLQATERAKAIAHGSVFDTITMRTFDYLEVPKFNDAEMRDLERRLHPLLELSRKTVVQNRVASELRDMLLPQLMSGKIRVKDAEDRVGEVL